MNEKARDAVFEKKNEEMTTVLNKNILFKEYNNANDLKDTFINIKSDYSIESEKEKNNISLFNVLKKKLKGEKGCTRFLIIFKISNDENENKTKINDIIKNIIKEKYETITGVCLFVNIYFIILLESPDTKNVFNLLHDMTNIKYISELKILYFSELNKQKINEDFYFFEYKIEDQKGILTECNFVDEVCVSPLLANLYMYTVKLYFFNFLRKICLIDKPMKLFLFSHFLEIQIWDLYINILNLCCFIKDNDKKDIFEKNENLKKNFSTLSNFYTNIANEYIWKIDGTK
ncbi:hypothetical protein [Plasmodium yoelii yoelii]|uniref:Uncharacterized protein n=1 Tax=Plasmodium yoelii yoelii TaxID=73239 RepID=Q7RNT1_PLAYO|nr:hypothetical protein [Plasmodium yoelii yoelii]